MPDRQVALIIGAGDATGGAVARRFAREGYAAVIVRRDADNLTDLAARIRAEGGEAHPFGVDARLEEPMVELFDRVEADIGQLEAVIFNIGANVYFPIGETTARVYRKVWEMAAYAGFLTGREAARLMLPRGRGSLFFTGATASMRGASGYAAFAAAKCHRHGAAQAMARELGPKGIHVAHLIIDAGVDTAFVRGRIADARGQEAADNLPKDVLMEPTSIAEAYWQLHVQTRDGWTHELDLRPYGETW